MRGQIVLHGEVVGFHVPQPEEGKPDDILAVTIVLRKVPVLTGPLPERGDNIRMVVEFTPDHPQVCDGRTTA